MSLLVMISNNLSNTIPATAAGTLATNTLAHRVKMRFCSDFDLSLPKGQMVFQNSRMTAQMAPSWMTTSNISQNSAIKVASEEKAKGNHSSSRIKCPVELTGNHSVTPSTIPYRMAFNNSQIIKAAYLPFYQC